MRIIFIGKNKYFEDKVSNNLKDLVEQDSLLFFYSYPEAEDFINNNIISNQVPLDLIITENNVKNIKAHEFYQSIIRDKKRTYSNCDFKFCKIPVILIADKDENKNAFLNYAFSDVIDNIGFDKLNLFVSGFQSVIKSWRRQVLDDLDNIGIQFNSGIINYDIFFSERNKTYSDTKVLSDNFLIFPRVLNYQWLKLNERQIEKAIDEYIKELKRATRLNKKQEEKRFHKLFNEYPFLLRRDNYDKHWYQPKLYYSKSKYFEPDYSLKPNFNRKTDLSILEIKLPNEGFIKKKIFHPGPYHHVIEHINQVNDYKDYLESEQYYKKIKDKFGFFPNSIEYNILMGRRDDKTEGFKIFNNRMRQLQSQHINFITYDDLLEYQVKFLARMEILKII